MSRYIDRITAFNELDFYKKMLDKRGVKRIEQYRTDRLKDFEIESVSYIERVWSDGDSFWKLSTEFYSDPQYWYVIARFNNAPTEAHVSVGDTIKIPLSLTTALQVIV